jgi:MraZ protein
VAARFFGRYEHSLDTKGRVILPARFRSHFGERAYITQFQEGCLAVWTQDEFDKQMDDKEASQEAGRDERNDARVWAAGSHEVELDRQGRLQIPAYLREFAHLETNVLVTGALNRIELWNPADWDRRVKPSEARLVDEGPEAPTMQTNT